MKTILLTEPIDAAGLELLDARPDIAWRIAPACDVASLADAVTEADAVIVRVAPLPEAVLEQASRLQIVSKHGVGCDNVAVDYLTRVGLPMAIAAGANAQSVAEHTMALMLAAARRLREQDRAMRAGRFEARHDLVATDLDGARGLVIGFGRIGRRVARLMTAFGMSVTVADIALDRDHARAIGVRGIVDFRTALPEADFVTLHVPLDASTRHMIDRGALAAFKPGAVFVNCARGGIVDEDALGWALEHGPLRAAGIDVFTMEPTPADHPLFGRDDVVVSPHGAASAFGSIRATAMMCAQNVLDHFDGCLREECLFNVEILRRG